MFHLCYDTVFRRLLPVSQNLNQNDPHNDQKRQLQASFKALNAAPKRGRTDCQKGHAPS